MTVFVTCHPEALRNPAVGFVAHMRLHVKPQEYPSLARVKCTQAVPLIPPARAAEINKAHPELGLGNS